MDYLIWLFSPQTQTSGTDISNRWITFRYYCCHLVTARENKQRGRMRATAQLFCYVLVSLTIKRLLFYTASKMDIICMLYYAITLSALIGLCVHHRPYKLHNRRQKQIYTGIKHCTSNTLWKKIRAFGIQKPISSLSHQFHHFFPGQRAVFVVTDIYNSRMLFVFSN